MTNLEILTIVRKLAVITELVADLEGNDNDIEKLKEASKEAERVTWWLDSELDKADPA